jgi:RimJ/RimL family protein N-acetyltransferase
MMKPPEIIETERLRLRPPVMEDAEAIFERYAQDTEVTKYLTWRPHRSIEETQDYLRRCLSVWEQASAFPWVICRKSDGQFIGMVEIRLGDHKSDLGYVLAREFWGNGYAPEAVKAITEWALAQAGVWRVWAVCDVDNLASARVLEKVGMQREGVLRRWIIHPNVSAEPSDAFCYAIVR